MVKIVIFVAIATLAFVNAQNFRFPVLPGFPAGGPFDLIRNMKVISPEELINRQPGPNEKYHASYASSDNLDGKMRGTVMQNDNGKKTGYSITN